MKTLWLLSTLVLLELINLTTSAQAAQSQLDNGSAGLNQGSSGDMVVADAREDFEDWLERNGRDRDDDDDDDRRDRDRNDDDDDDDDDDRVRDRQDEAREDWEERRDRGDWEDDWEDDRLGDRDRDDDDDDDDDDDRIRDRDDNPIRTGRENCVNPRDDHQGWRWILDQIGRGCE
ncbi:hypothetical protein H6G00_05370 [Leptolyngbya sp. FACHB-541]|uniref:hypothetical protein n=1 Tax=Leptolyngbya sp. FACHB-541 TaxID=2692810 RepID=UPI00168283B9|nr:hypothetical protein [Leptolyngbya sp. FACHB-541]MBD1996046.1 hypothetical protein [Leptolyngbya sp. FACHB-541]